MDNRVRLCDGSLVASDSEAWRLECEARHLLTLSGEARERYIQGMPPARLEALRLTAKRIRLHHARNALQSAGARK